MKIQITFLAKLAILVPVLLSGACKRDSANLKITAINAKTETFAARTYYHQVLAGKTNSGGYADGVGAAARFSGPSGLWVNEDGSLAIADRYNDKIRHVVHDSLVFTYHFPDVTDGPKGKIIQPLGVSVLPYWGYVGIVCAHDIFYYKPYDQQGQPERVSHTIARPGQTYHAIGIADVAHYWISINNTIVTNVFGYINTEAYTDGLGVFPTTDPVTAISNVYPQYIVYATTSTKFYKVTGYVEGDSKGEASGPLFPMFTFVNITGIACSKDGSKIYVADNGDIKVMNVAPRTFPTLTTILTGVAATGIALSNDGAYLYYTSDSRNTVSRVFL